MFSLSEIPQNKPFIQIGCYSSLQPLAVFKLYVESMFLRKCSKKENMPLCVSMVVHERVRECSDLRSDSLFAEAQ